MWSGRDTRMYRWNWWVGLVVGLAVATPLFMGMAALASAPLPRESPLSIRLLFVGVANYPSPNALVGVDADEKAWRDIVGRWKRPASNAIFLRDDHATFAAIGTTLQQWSNAAIEEVDLFVFAFSGNGMRDGLYLTDPGAPDVRGVCGDCGRRGVSPERLAAWTASVRAPHKLIVLDANSAALAGAVIQAALKNDVGSPSVTETLVISGLMAPDSDQGGWITRGVTEVLGQLLNWPSSTLCQGDGTRCDRTSFLVYDARTPGFVHRVPFLYTLRAQVPAVVLSKGRVEVFTASTRDPWFTDPPSPTNSRTPMVPEAPPPTTSKPPARRLALVTGTDSYDKHTRLHNAVLDATMLRKKLVDSFGYELCDSSGCGPGHGIVENASKLDWTRANSNLAETAGENDDVLIFIAGHGYKDPLVDEGFIMHRDAEEPFLCKNEIGCTTMSRLPQNISNLKAKHVLVIVDTCYSGVFGLKRNARDGKQTVVGVEELKRNYGKESSRFFITSGGLREVQDGERGKGSPFARRLLQVLDEGLRNSGAVRFEDLVAALTALPALENTPTYGSFKSMGHGEEAGTFLLMPPPAAAP